MSTEFLSLKKPLVTYYSPRDTIDLYSTSPYSKEKTFQILNERNDEKLGKEWSLEWVKDLINAPEKVLSDQLSEPFADSLLMFENHLWNTTFFFPIFYLLSIFSLALYFVPLVSFFISFDKFKNQTTYVHINFETICAFLLLPSFIITALVLSWISPTTYVWFSQLTVSTTQRPITIFCLLAYVLLIYIYSANLIFNTKEIYDFMIILHNTLVWLFLLFYANNLFAIIFFIETLTSLTILVLITSTFSSSYSYDTANFPKSLYFQPLIPKEILNSLIYFFWMSLLSSLLLFLFLILFYTSTFALELSLANICLNFTSTTALITQFLATSLVLMLFTITIFLKCGLVPLFIWKPTVFKGLTMHAIFFYICFYYHFLLIFLLRVLIVDIPEITWYNKTTLNVLLILGVFVLFFILLESYYLKSFLAMSSILNTLLIFIGFLSVPTSVHFFNL